jgi:hypothetical protein
VFADVRQVRLGGGAVAPVNTPEPTTITLLGTGMLSMLGLATKRKIIS